ncbi:hypothetical protein DMA15_36385 [Streptomyces sp. WAC 01529]|nr:hypothetical protein DMA15_36385 [Streptomyces sp. WAC 01529]
MENMRHDQAAPDCMVITAHGLNWTKAARALWLAPGAGKRAADPRSIPYQSSVTTQVVLITLSSVVEIALVDFLLSAAWARVLALAVGLLALIVILALVVALRAFPHRVEKGTLTVHYGATFEVPVPLDRVTKVTERRSLSGQKRTAEVADGVLSVPMMGVTNLAVTLDPPVEMTLPKADTATVREIRLFAIDPVSGTRTLRGGGRPETTSSERSDIPAAAAPARTGTPHNTPRWMRWLRWTGVLVLLAEIVLVTTGLLDWRIAAGILVVTEGALAVLGLIAGAAFISQYRRLRAAGETRADSFSDALFSLMPEPMAAMVRRELSVVRVLTLVLLRRTERPRPGDLPLSYGSASRKALVGTAALLLVAGVSALLSLAPGVPRIVLGVVLLYAALLTATMGLAAGVRPHLLRADGLVVRWGLHHELEIPLATVRSITLEQPARGRPKDDITSDRFTVPASGREQVAVVCEEPVEVPARWGARRPAQTIVVPVDDSKAVLAYITRPAGA